MEKRTQYGLILAPVALLTGLGCQAESDANVSTLERRIVGGAELSESPHAYPWMAKLSTKSGSSSEFSFACGASLIAKNWVLTAGHCVSEQLTVDGVTAYVALDPDEVQITLGDRDRNSTETYEQVLEVEDIIVHPDFVPAYETYFDENGYENVRSIQAYYDIALVKLKTNARLDQHTQVIRLASENDVPGQDTMLSGWGSTTPGNGERSIVLKELDAVVVPAANEADACNQRILAEKPAYSFQRALDDASEICTYNFLNDEVPAGEESQSACYGDSGSPWVVEESSCSEQIGVHFWGDVFCVSYNVGQRVSAYLPWIREQGVDYIGDRVYEAENMNHQTGGSHPGGWNIWNNGYISFNHTFDGGQESMIVRAAAQEGRGWPRMRVTVGGNTVFENNVYVPVSSGSWGNYPINFSAPPGGAEVRIYFVNDFYQAPVDRNLFIDTVKVIDKETTCAPGEIEAEVVETQGGDTWYCAEVRITNPSSKDTTDWRVVIDVGDDNVYVTWNPNSAYFGPGEHAIEPQAAWHQIIRAGTTNTETGYCAYRTGSSDPEVVSATATF
jgi:secreted trypsin-like serine protease